jgi:hypothetical protein
MRSHRRTRRQTVTNARSDSHWHWRWATSARECLDRAAATPAYPSWANGARCIHTTCFPWGVCCVRLVSALCHRSHLSPPIGQGDDEERVAAQANDGTSGRALSAPCSRVCQRVRACVLCRLHRTVTVEKRWQRPSGSLPLAACSSLPFRPRAIDGYFRYKPQTASKQ